MREIIFRGKRVDNGEWVYGDLINNEGDTFIFISYGVKPDGFSYVKIGGATVGYIIEVVSETIGQFTGLTDKNGGKIFEGDKFRWFGFEVDAGKQIRPTRELIVDFKYSALSGIESIIKANGTGEVIGNIHENK